MNYNIPKFNISKTETLHDSLTEYFKTNSVFNGFKTEDGNTYVFQTFTEKITISLEKYVSRIVKENLETNVTQSFSVSSKKAFYRDSEISPEQFKAVIDDNKNGFINVIDEAMTIDDVKSLMIYRSLNRIYYNNDKSDYNLTSTFYNRKLSSIFAGDENQSFSFDMHSKIFQELSNSNFDSDKLNDPLFGFNLKNFDEISYKFKKLSVNKFKIDNTLDGALTFNISDSDLNLELPLDEDLINLFISHENTMLSSELSEVKDINNQFSDLIANYEPSKNTILKKAKSKINKLF